MLEPIQHHADIRATTMRHHALARYVAQGLPSAQISLLTGYTTTTIDHYRTDNPAFAELVAFYKKEADIEGIDGIRRAQQVGRKALEALDERLDESPGAFENRELLEIASDFLIKTSIPKPGAATGGAASPVQVTFVMGDKSGPTIDLKPEPTDP